MAVLTRNHVVEHGQRDARPMIFAHGFGCDQSSKEQLPAILDGLVSAAPESEHADDICALVARLDPA